MHAHFLVAVSLFWLALSSQVGEASSSPTHEVYLPGRPEAVAARAPMAPPRRIADGDSAGPAPSVSHRWIPGYWEFDAEAQTFDWVGGVWRVPPPGRVWVEGYWVKADGEEQGYRRTAGFWAPERRRAFVRKRPPEDPPAEQMGVSPGPEYFSVAGHYEATAASPGVKWVPGFWTKQRPGWTWVSAIWLERPGGWWIYQEGYWVLDEVWRYPPHNGLSLSLTLPQAAERVRQEAMAAEPDAGTVPSVFPGDRGDVIARIQATIDGSRRFAVPLPGGGGGGGYAQQSSGSGAAGPPMRSTPAATYYIGNTLPGSTYPSYSTNPTANAGQSSFTATSLPGSSYPSYSSSPAGNHGASYYIGNSGQGSSYPSYTTTGNSVGGYGYGTPAPGSTGGQVGTGSGR